MSTPTMKWVILFCLAICLVSDTSVSAQIKGQPVSILIHSTIHLESGQSVKLVVTSKEKKYIRASIRNPKKMARADIIYDGKAITMVEKGTLQSKSRVVSGDEAATNLFDLFALNPEYYFKKMLILKNDINSNLLLSMGMSSDYELALECDSNLIRIGSKIFN